MDLSHGYLRAPLPGDDVGRGVRRLLAVAGQPRPDRTALDPAGRRPGGGAGGPKAAAAGGVGKGQVVVTGMIESKSGRCELPSAFALRVGHHSDVCSCSDL